MPIAYFITCHRSDEFIADQINILYRKQDLFIYHIDPKAPDRLKNYILDLAENNNNIIVMPPRDYSWAGFSQVYTVIDAIVIALACGRGWTHFIPLSEQHLPTTRPDAIERSLMAGTSYIGSNLYSEMPPDAQRDIRHRFDKLYLELPGVGSFATKRLEPESGFFNTLRHGSNWYVLSRENCIHLRAIFANDRKIDKLKHCVHADETIVITLSYLVPDLVGRISNTEKTFVAWPHLTDNPDMIFTEDNFFRAIDEGKPFIRKRPEVLPERVKAALGLQRPRSRHTLIDYFKNKARKTWNNSSYIVAPLPRMPETKNVLVEALFRKNFTHGSWTVYHNNGNSNIPNILMSYKTPQLPNDLSIFVLSQDGLTFKIAIVTDAETTSLFTDTNIYGKDAFLIRARVAHLFFHYELSIDDGDSGFVDVVDLENPSGLLNKFHFYVDHAENLHI